MTFRSQPAAWASWRRTSCRASTTSRPSWATRCVERLVVVSEETTVDLASELAVGGPAPLQEAERSHEHQAALAAEESGTVDVRDGVGAEIFLLVRCWTPESAREEGPAGGAARDRPARAGWQKDRRPAGDRGAAFRCRRRRRRPVAVEPGSYLLRWSDRFGSPPNRPSPHRPGGRPRSSCSRKSTVRRPDPARSAC